ncbi:MAG: CDP-alcohol phosphatidyltransferase family protein [Planctomycetes bacterium]|nr:CDP-alcohol phosphatidyltransferase family protein [Planctomycetota bacterium]
MAGGIVMLAGAAMDMYDGAVARLGGKESTFGAMLDSVLDRLGETAVLFGLLVFYVRAANDGGAYLAFGALAASLMVSYLRARSEGLGVPGDVGLMGRPERIVVLGAGLLLGYPAWALGIIAALASLTVVQRAVHVWRAGRRA